MLLYLLDATVQRGAVKNQIIALLPVTIPDCVAVKPSF